jgi:hypothetical protein
VPATARLSAPRPASRWPDRAYGIPIVKPYDAFKAQDQIGADCEIAMPK